MPKRSTPRHANGQSVSPTTAPAMLDRIYGHMLPDALDCARSALDAFIDGRETCGLQAISRPASHSSSAWA
jgi:hypothetical protein